MTDSGTADVTVVVVTYNRADLVEPCLRSISCGTDRLRLEVVVVDNSEGRQVSDLVASEFPEATLLDNQANLGFARACNLGVSRGSGEFVLLLNPDTVVHPGAIDALVEHFSDDPGVGLLGGRTVRPDGTLDPSSCWGPMTIWSLFCFATGLSWAFKHNRLLDPESLGEWQRDSVREVGVVTGCLLLTSRRVWDVLGGFDQDFFMYAEDADLTWRARQAGYRPSITPRATITHVVGATSPSTAGRTILHNTGLCTLMRKRWRGVRLRVALELFTAGVGLRTISYRTASRGSGTARDKATTWAEIWSCRRIWRAGYPHRGPAVSSGESMSGPVR